MKSNVKKLKLIEYGFKAKTVMSLNETQINSLYNRLVETKKKESNEAELVIDPNNPNDLEIAKQKGMVGPEGKIRIPVGEEDNIDSDDALGDVAMQQSTGQETPHDEKDMAPDGMDDDSDINRKEMGEIKIKDLLFKKRKKWDRGSDSKAEKVAKKDIRKHYHKYGDPFEPDVESSPKFAIGLDDPNFMIGESETNEKFESKSQQKYFFARCNDKSLSKKERNKWCKMADEFAADTKNFSKLPEKKKSIKEIENVTHDESRQYENRINKIYNESLPEITSQYFGEKDVKLTGKVNVVVNKEDYEENNKSFRVIYRGLNNDDALIGNGYYGKKGLTIGFYKSSWYHLDKENATKFIELMVSLLGIWGMGISDVLPYYDEIYESLTLNNGKTINIDFVLDRKTETNENYLDMIGNAMNKNMKNKISDIRPGLKFEQVVEKEMERIVEKYIQPKITKQDFLGIVGNLDMDKPKGKIKNMTNEQGPGIAPSKPKIKPDTKPKKPGTPYSPKPGPKPAPKADVEIAPSKPKVKPGTKPTKPGTPYRPKPGPKPAPKAGEKNIPDWLTFDKLNINFK